MEDYLPFIEVAKMKDDGLTIDYGLTLSGPYDLTNHLATWQKEAGVKGCTLVVTVQLMPQEEFYGPLLDENGETENGESAETTTD